MLLALQIVAGAVLTLLLVLLGFLSRRISQNEKRIHEIEKVIAKLSNDVQHRLTGVETDLKWIKKEQETQSKTLQRIEDFVRKEGD